MISRLKKMFFVNTCDCYKLPLDCDTHVPETPTEHPFGGFWERLKNWGAIAVSARQHAGPKYYIAIAVILTVVTVIEILALNWRLDHTLLVTTMLVLAVLKFILVIAFYMHLKFDNRFYAIVFGACMALGLVLFVALLILIAFYGR